MELSNPENKLSRKKQIVLLDMERQVPRDTSRKSEHIQEFACAPGQGGVTLAGAFRDAAVDRRFQRQPCYPIAVQRSSPTLAARQNVVRNLSQSGSRILRQPN